MFCTNKTLSNLESEKGQFEKIVLSTAVASWPPVSIVHRSGQSPGRVKYAMKYNRKPAQVIFSLQLFVPTGIVGARFDLNPQILDT